MPLITPVKTLGGLAWWTTVRSDSLFILQKLVEAALPRHLQLTGTALEYENAVLAFLGDYVRRSTSAHGPETESATEELLVEENLTSPPMSPSRHEDADVDSPCKVPRAPSSDKKKEKDAIAPLPKVAPAASAPALVGQGQTPGGDAVVITVPARVDHVFILVHGINGKVTDMQDFETHLRQLDIFSQNTVIFRSAVNQEAGTHQGIEIAGIRLTAEIMEILHRIPHDQTPNFSIAAHSLGGLISRCAIGKLEMLGAFNRLRPTTFMTLCTPHLSSRRVGGVFGHYGKAIWQKMVHYFVQTQGETGKELLLADSENGAAPLLVRMTNPDSDYMKGLRRFAHPTAVGVTHFDLLVPYASAVMRAHNPHHIPPWYILVDWNNPNVLSVTDWSNFAESYLTLFTRFIRRASRPPFLPSGDPPPEDTENGFCCDRLHTVEFTHAMFHNLNSIPWRRLEIQYGGGPQGLHIHEQVIKCKKHWKAPLLNEATASDSVTLFCSIIRQDHFAQLHALNAPNLIAPVPPSTLHPSSPVATSAIQMHSPPSSPVLLTQMPTSVTQSSPAILAVVQSNSADEKQKERLSESGSERMGANGKEEEKVDGKEDKKEQEALKPRKLIDELRDP